MYISVLVIIIGFWILVFFRIRIIYSFLEWFLGVEEVYESKELNHWIRFISLLIIVLTSIALFKNFSLL